MADFSRYDGPSEDWLPVQATLAPPPVGISATDQRAFINKDREAASAAAIQPLLSQVEMKDYSVPTRDGAQLEARTYRPTSVDKAKILPVYIHLHGGGFLLGSLASEDATCVLIATRAKVIVFNLNYRHTPEHIYPTAWNDVDDAFDWLGEHIKEIGGDPDKVVVGGISAGAQLAASVTLQRHLNPPKKSANELSIAGQMLLIPCLTHTDSTASQLKKLKDPSLSSYVTNANAPFLPMSRAKFFFDLLQVENASEDDVRLSPGNATPEQVKGLPPTVFGIAGLDPFRDDGLLYAKMLTEAGVSTNINLFKGVPHGFRRFGHKLSASARWDKLLEEGIWWMLSKPSPSEEFVINV